MILPSRGHTHGHSHQYQKQNTCRNCGEVGHLYKGCTRPIMSFGLICYRHNEITNEVEYLMIQRRDSLSFMEFIRGKYDVMDFSYIKRLMSFMTDGERKLLVTKSFDDLWNQVWHQPYIPKQTQEYTDAREKFMKLRGGVVVHNEFVSLTILLTQTETKFMEPEWGFPKGRRKLRERDIDCGVREFCEETGFAKGDIVLDIMEIPYEEIFYGTNGIQYRHVYYIAKIIHNVYRSIVIDNNNPHQAREVRQIKWFSAQEVIDHIRDHNQERKVLFGRVVSYIQGVVEEK